MCSFPCSAWECERDAPRLYSAGDEMGRNRYKLFENGQPCFMTCTILNWSPLFADKEIAQIIIDSLSFLQKEKHLALFGYIIMENHLHLIASGETLAKEISNFKSFTARKIIDCLKEKKSRSILNQLKYFKLNHKKDRTYQFWQEGSHPELIQNEKMMKQKLEYIHYNPVQRGYVDDPAHWRYSSARNYAGQDSLLDVCMEW